MDKNNHFFSIFISKSEYLSSIKVYAFKDAFISEAFFIIGFISLSSFQRNMIETYNGKAPRKSTKTEVETKKEGKH